MISREEIGMKQSNEKEQICPLICKFTKKNKTVIINRNKCETCDKLRQNTQIEYNKRKQSKTMITVVDLKQGQAFSFSFVTLFSNTMRSSKKSINLFASCVRNHEDATIS
jgi:hypothetical protein